MHFLTSALQITEGSGQGILVAFVGSIQCQWRDRDRLYLEVQATSS
jgi:hypothetical protein